MYEKLKIKRIKQEDLDEYDKIHCYENRITLAEIYIEGYFEERVISDKYRSKKYGPCKIQMYDNEGPIPHFHIENKNKSFRCCIKLTEPEYFDHGKNTGKLNTDDVKNLIKLLKQPADEGLDITLYEFMCALWNNSYNKNKEKINHPYIMPDYTKLNN